MAHTKSPSSEAVRPIVSVFSGIETEAPGIDGIRQEDRDGKTTGIHRNHWLIDNSVLG